MPRKIHSKAQWRKLHAMAERGEISHKKVSEMAEGVNYKRLPERKKTRAGNTEFYVKQPRPKSTVSEQSIRDEYTIDSVEERLVEVPNSCKSQVEEIPIRIGNRMPKGY